MRKLSAVCRCFVTEKLTHGRDSQMFKIQATKLWLGKNAKLKIGCCIGENFKSLKCYFVSKRRRFDPKAPGSFPKKYNNYRFSVRGAVQLKSVQS